jgi:hypothetical protein
MTIHTDRTDEFDKWWKDEKPTKRKKPRLQRFAQYISALLKAQRHLQDINRQIDEEFAGLGRLSRGIEDDIMQLRYLLLKPTIRSKKIANVDSQFQFDCVNYGETEQMLEQLLQARSEAICNLVNLKYKLAKIRQAY